MKNNNNRDFKKVLETLDANEKVTNERLLKLIDEVFVPQAQSVKVLYENLEALAQGVEFTHNGTATLFENVTDLIQKLDTRITNLEKKVAQLEK